jgi:hypothetical protein
MDEPILSFALEARHFCALLERDEEANSWVFARECLSSLLRLYEKAMYLPAVLTTPGHWRVMFELHWAKHASDAIAALSAICYGQYSDPSRPA